MSGQWKRNTAAALSVLLALGSIALPVQAAEKEAAASYGEYRSGSVGEQALREDEYTVISLRTEEEFAGFAEQCRLDAWSSDKLAVLENDIALSEHSDLSIPVFSGIFEGNGYRITNLRLTGNGSAQGLFRYIQQGGTVRNLNVEGKVAPGGSGSCAGGIVGVNYGRVINCSFSGSVLGDSEIGGIAGVNEKTGEIRRCTSGAVVIGSHSTGGISGVNHGTLNNCVNTGDINTYSTEVSLNLEDLTMENLEDLNSTSNVAAHTDSGGIAGLSEGKIYYCTNSGTVGYPHVGYNSGGIAGRLSQGYIQNCTNTGRVMGRKDTGGIAGQMEPFLEITYLNDKLSELDAETDVFIEMLDKLHGDLSGYGSQASALSRNVTANLKNVSAAAGNLTGLGNELFYLYNQELNAISNDGNILDDELKALNEENKNQNGGQEEHPSPSVSSGDVKDAIDDLFDRIDGKDDGTSDNKDDTDDGNQSAGNSGQNGSKNDTGDIGSGDWKPSLPDNSEAYRAALEKFGRNVGGRLGNMTNGTGDRSKAVTDNLDILNKEMQAAADHLSMLAETVQTGGDRAGDDLDALVEQARVLRRLLSDIRDELFSYEGITVEDRSDEAVSSAPAEAGSADADGAQNGDADPGEKRYDTSSFQKGKITRSVNKGEVRADTNVGGIVGQIATEFDFDPEDDITLTGKESFDIEQTIKAVVRDSRNLGEVTGKKDYAGGIAGKADFGAIISCESYGAVSSTDGSCVGGIAGASSYAIRGCYSMGALSGKDNVGGIAGKGCDIFYSRAYNTIGLEGERAGAIAGTVQENGMLCGNYYVEASDRMEASDRVEADHRRAASENRGGIGGVDGVGYAGGAYPLPYEEFCALNGLPEAFTSFTVTFLIDGREAASYQCGYGDALTPEQIPDIPEREGFYGRWPEFDFGCVTGNRVLEAQYEKWVGSLASAQTGENGMPLLLAEGEFLPGTQLSAVCEGDEIRFAVTGGEASEESVPVTVRVLCPDGPEDTEIEVMEGGGFRPAESTVIGSYRVVSLELGADRAGVVRLAAAKETDHVVWILSGAAAAGLLALFLIGRAIRKKKRG